MGLYWGKYHLNDKNVYYLLAEFGGLSSPSKSWLELVAPVLKH